MIVDSNFTFSNPIGFIVIEGVNGAGKSALIKKAADYLIQHSVPHLITREPGSPHSEVTKAFRRILLEGAAGKLAPRTEAFLFCADRAEHTESVIRPALKEGKIVLTDRFYFSSIAFQGYARGLGPDFITHINELAVNHLKPDVVLLLDFPPEKGLERNKLHGQKVDAAKDTFEDEETHFHNEVRRGFLEIAKNSEVPFFVIDAMKSPDEVFDEARRVIEPIIKKIA